MRAPCISTHLPERCAGILRRLPSLLVPRRGYWDLVPLPVPLMNQPPLAPSLGGETVARPLDQLLTHVPPPLAGIECSRPAVLTAEKISRLTFLSPAYALLPLTRLCSNIQLCPSLTIWDGLLKGSCPPFSMLSRPNHAASVSLLLPTSGHLNSDLAVCGYSLERSGMAIPSSLVETGD